ncbi:MAG: PKD domain-containing protein [Cyclobacteriaceae bacterium]|nr:PKD domain-containing protein [Cyclobacteriaceae bacterium]
MRSASSSKLKVLFLLPVLLLFFSFAEGIKEVPSIPLAKDFVESEAFTNDTEATTFFEGGENENTFYIDGEVVNPSVEVPCEEDFAASYICDDITGQDITFAPDPTSVCSPRSVNFRMRFLFPAEDVGSVAGDYVIQFFWDFDNDISNRDNVNATWVNAGFASGYEATTSHIYPKLGSTCTYHVRARLIIVGSGTCFNANGYVDREIVVWDDIANSNIGTHDINQNPASAGAEVGETVEICKGDDSAVILDDASTFNCTPPFETNVSNQNQQARWVQWVYGTSNTVTTGGLGAPNTEKIAIDGVYYDASELPVYGVPEYLPASVTTPNSNTLDVQMPTIGTNVGEIFVVTLRSWNTCNPFDDNVGDANGLNPNQAPMTYNIYNPLGTVPSPLGGPPFYASSAPITRTYNIEIVDIPAQLTVTDQKICVGDAIPILTVGNIDGGATEINWYDDNKWTNPLANLLSTGGPPNNFNPAAHGASSAAANSYSYWVTQRTGGATNCESEPVEVTLEVYDNPVPSPSYTIVSGASQCDMVTLDLDASGTTNTVPGQTTYYWEIDNNSSFASPEYTVGPITSSTFNGLVVNHLGATTNRRTWNMRVTVANPASNAGCTVTTEGADFFTYLTPTLITSGDETMCSGGTTNIVLDHNSNSDANQRYNWTVATSGSVGFVTGASNGGPETHPYTIAQTLVNNTFVPQTATYTITVTNVQDGQSCTSTSEDVVITINPIPPKPTISEVGDGLTICEDGSSTILQSSNVGGAAITFEWYKAPDFVTPVQSGASNQLSLTTVAQSGTYHVKTIGVGNCESALSNGVVVTINSLPTGDVSGGGAVCFPNPAPDVVFAMGGTGTFNLIYAIDGTPQAAVNGITSPYSISNPAVGTYTIVSVEDANCITTAPDANITGSAVVSNVGGIPPNMNSITPETAVCDDGAATTSPGVVVEFDLAGDYDIYWTVNGNNRSILGASSTAVPPFTITLPTGYAADFSSTPGTYAFTITSVIYQTGCSVTPLGPVNVVINPRPANATNPVNNISCETGGGVALSVDAPPAGNIIHWYQDAGLTVDADPGFGTASGSQNEIFTPTASTTATFYAVVESTTAPTNCQSLNAASVTQTEDKQPSLANAEDSTPIGTPPAVVGTCDDTFVLNATAADNGGTGTWTASNGSITFDNANDPGTTARNIPLGTYTFTWTVTTALGVCATSSDNYDVTRHTLPDALDSTPSVCEDAFGGNSYLIPDLTVYNDDVTGIVGSTNRTIEYFSAPGRTPGDLINPPTNHSVTTVSNIVYTRVTRTDVTPNCTKDGTLTFTIVSRPDAIDQDAGVNAAETEFCEDFPVGSGTKSGINLTDLDDDVSNGLANRTVTWFTNATHTVLVPDPTNASAVNNQLFYPRVTETASGQSCTNDAVVTITVNPRPADNPILGANTQCVGGATSLYQITPGPVGTTYNWNIPGQFTVFAGGTINDFFVLLQFPTATVQTLEVTEVNPEGCDGNVQQLSITVQGSPPISAIAGAAAVCENETGIVYSVTNTPNTTYAWTVPTGASIILGQGTNSITVNFGSTGGNVQVIPSSSGGCSGGTATKPVTVNKRPILDAGLNTTVCSDDNISITLAADGSSPVAAASYNITASVAPGLVANVGPTTGNGLTSAAIFNDNYTNKTGGPLNVTYTVTPISADNCAGNSVNVIATIDPEPIMATGLGVTECSDVAIGLTLNTAAGSVLASSYNITGVIIPGGLTAGTNAVVPQTGVAANYLINDTYTNTGNAPLVVQYTAVPVSADGCPGDALVINATINPEPVVSTLLDKTVCSDNAIALNLATNGVSVAAANYNLVNVSIPGGLVPGGSNAAFPSNGVANNFIASDKYKNQTTLPIDVTYQVQGVSVDGCIGKIQPIVVTIDPEPVINGSLSTSVCSDDASGITLSSVGTAIPATNYNLVDVTIPAGATAAGTNVIFPASNVVDTYIASDSYTNKTAAAIDVIYEVQGVSAAGCVGDSEFITLTVDPEPVINPALDVTVCSHLAIGVTLSTNGTSVAAASYDVLGITLDPGLTAAGTNVLPANGVLASYISGDKYTNTTNGSLTATYEVRGTAGGTGCKGDSEFIVVTVDPEPVISLALNTTVCSDGSIGITLTNNGTSIAAANYNIVSVNIPVGITAAGTNAAVPASGVASNYLSTDKYTNQTSGALIVQYDVQGVSGAGCIGDIRTISVTINPEPVIDPGLDATVCSDAAIGLTLNTNGTSVAAANYNIVAVTIPAGLSAGANAVVPANGVAAGYLAGDTYTNQTNSAITVIYEVKGVSASACIGDSEFINITIDPEPVVANSLGTTVCSNDAIGLNLATAATSVAAASYNVLSVSVPVGLTAGGTNAVIPGNAVAPGYLSSDTYYNPTSSSLNVTYNVQGNSAAGCTGDVRAITIVIEPEPVISSALDKTVCSDNNINLTLATNGTSVAAANYNIKSISIPAGVTAAGTNVVIPANTVVAGYLFNDSYTNKTAASLDVIYEVTGVSATGCESQSEFINVTINPEPVIDPGLDATVCSDGSVGIIMASDGISVAAATFNLISISVDAGLIAGGGNVAAANGVANNYFAGDTYTNKTLGPLTVTYEVRGVSGAGCVGDSEFIVATINPEPVVSNSLDATVCSDNAVGINLATDAASIGALNYNLVSINVPAGLTPDGSNAIVSNGVAANYIASDLFTNTTNGAINVTYEVQAVSAAGCVGDSEFIIATINPEPVIDPTLDTNVCSDLAIGLNFNTDVVSVAAATYNLIAVNVGAGLTAGGSNVVPASGIGAAYVANDKYTNTTNGSIDVTYEVRGVSAAGCLGDVQIITITIDPEPVMNNSLSTTVCSDNAVGVIFAGDGVSIAPTGYNIIGVTIPGSLTPNAGNVAIPASGQAANYISGDIYTNVSSLSQDVVYEVRGVSAAGCIGDSEFITVTISPEPVINLGLGTTICSDDPVGITLATNGTSVGAANYDVLSITVDPGLTPGVTNVIAANNVVAGYFTNDTYTNQTAGALNVVYEVRGNSADGCVGDIELINVVVNPDPVVDTGLDDVVCSGLATGLVLNTDGISIGASNYNIIGVTIDPNLTPSGSNAAIPASGVAAAYLSGDVFTNTTNSPHDVEYEVRGVSFSACEGDSEFITITIEPGPVINPALDATVCSDIAIGVNFSVNGGSVAASSYNVVGITPNPSLIPGGTNVGIANGVAVNYIASDTYTNTTSIPLNVIYEVKGVSATSCIGPSEFIVVTIDPEPVIDNGLDKTVCSDEPVGLILVTNGVSVGASTYNVIGITIDAGLVPGGTNATIPQSGVMDSYLSNDSYTNTTGGPLTVIYEARPESGSTCEGNSKFITITVDPEPVVNTGLNTSVCSDDPVGVSLSVEAGSVAAASYNIVSVTVPAGLTAAGSNVAVPANSVAPGYFSGDKYTNKTNSPINVLYEVKGVSGAGCEGDSRIITVTINPEPVINPAITATVCSDNSIGINLGVSGTSVAATNYDVVSVTIPAGLTASGTNAAIPGLAVASGYLNADAYTNQTASPINVTYEIKGNSALGCKGDSEFITVSINPEPVINPGLNRTVCSNEVSGLVFSTNGTSVAAANYNLISVTPAGGLIAGGTNVFPANGVADSYVQNDTYQNTTSGDLKVDYIVAPVSPQGCVGDQLTITLTIHPQPVLDPSLSPAPVCSDVPSGVILAEDVGSIAAVSYNIVGITFDAGLVPGGSNASIGNGQAANAIAGDTYTNTSNVAKQARYNIVPVSADGCEGATQQVIFTVNPAPALASNLNETVCSGSNTTVVFGTTASSTPAANYNVTGVSVPVGLTPGVNAVVPANGVASAYLSTDSYVNTTNGTLVVDYTVVPVSGSGCLGPAGIISVTVEPDFTAIANNTKPTICSNDVADITLTSPSTPSAGSVVFNVTASASSGTVSGFSPSLSFLPNGYVISDNLVNVGNSSQTVTYTITPLAPGAAGGLSCTGSSIIEVVTVDPLPIITPGQSEVICSNEALNYTISTSNGLAGTTFTWPAPTLPAGVTGGSARVAPSSNPIGDTFVNSTSSRQVIVYQVTPFGPSALSCVGNTVNVQVYVDPLPDGTISIDQPVVCYGGNALLSFAMTVGTAPFEIVYNDGSSDITVSNIANSHFIALNNLTASTTYTFKSIKDVNGCEQILAGQNVTVTVEHPVADFTMDVDEDCTPLEVTFTNNDIQPGTQYDWNFGDGSPIFTSSDPTVTHTYVNNSTTSNISFSPTLIATITNGTVVCTNSMMDNVTINAGVSLNITPSETEGCSPLTVNFENNSQGVLTNRWYWREKSTSDENDIQTSKNVSYTLSNTTTSNIIYEVVYEGERNGCGDQVITEITVYPEVLADFTVAPSTTISITNPTITVTNTTGQKASWITLWEWGDGQSTTNVDPGSHTYDSFGEYELKLTIQDPNGVCESVKTQIITVEPTIPVVDFEADVTEGCLPLTIQFTNLSTSVDPDTYVWEFVDDTGKTIGTSTLENPEITFNKAGVINVTLSGSNPLGVTDTETKLGYIEIYEIPTASFSVRPETVFLPDQIMFTANLSKLADEFEWDFNGDGIPESEEFEPSFHYTEPGVYDVSLIAINSSTGCSDTLLIEKAVTVVESGTSDVPNGFFPGTGDGSSTSPDPGSPTGSNSVFLPRIKGVRDDGFMMQIFDRWGHLLFESDNKEVGWNGRHFNTGKLMPAGVYVYKLELVYVSGQQTTVVGDVNLIR